MIDNHGDIGVCWRLARTLAVQHGLRVRLFTDDAGALGWMVKPFTQDKLLAVIRKVLG